jgi:hypothetical protein
MVRGISSRRHHRGCPGNGHNHQHPAAGAVISGRTARLRLAPGARAAALRPPCQSHGPAWPGHRELAGPRCRVPREIRTPRQRLSATLACRGRHPAATHASIRRCARTARPLSFRTRAHRLTSSWWRVRARRPRGEPDRADPGLRRTVLRVRRGQGPARQHQGGASGVRVSRPTAAGPQRVAQHHQHVRWGPRDDWQTRWCLAGGRPRPQAAATADVRSGPTGGRAMAHRRHRRVAAMVARRDDAAVLPAIGAGWRPRVDRNTQRHSHGRAPQLRARRPLRARLGRRRRGTAR